jgi:hypothetical protein
MLGSSLESLKGCRSHAIRTAHLCDLRIARILVLLVRERGYSQILHEDALTNSKQCFSDGRCGRTLYCSKIPGPNGNCIPLMRIGGWPEGHQSIGVASTRSARREYCLPQASMGLRVSPLIDSVSTIRCIAGNCGLGKIGRLPSGLRGLTQRWDRTRSRLLQRGGASDCPGSTVPGYTVINGRVDLGTSTLRESSAAPLQRAIHAFH